MKTEFLSYIKHSLGGCTWLAHPEEHALNLGVISSSPTLDIDITKNKKI